MRTFLVVLALWIVAGLAIVGMPSSPSCTAEYRASHQAECEGSYWLAQLVGWPMRLFGDE